MMKIAGSGSGCYSHRFLKAASRCASESEQNGEQYLSAFTSFTAESRSQSCDSRDVFTLAASAQPPPFDLRVDKGVKKSIYVDFLESILGTSVLTAFTITCQAILL